MTTASMDRTDPTHIFKVLLIIMSCLFVYSPVFHGDWLWDDDSEITAHAALRHVEGLGKIWTAQSSVDFLPLKSTFQWFFFRFAGANPVWWHLLNVSLQIVNSLLVWKLTQRLGVRQAWIAGILFAIHPLAVCSVAWISELKNTLSLPLLILSMLFYLAYDERQRPKDLIFSVLLFLAALLTKASGVMFPFVILLYTWWKRMGDPSPGRSPAGEKSARLPAIDWLEQMPWRGILSSAPFFLISLCVGLATIYFQHSRAIGPEVIPLGGLLPRIALSGEAAWFYLYKAVMPFRLLPNYPRWAIDPPSLVQLLAWPAMIGLMVFFWTRRRTWGRHAMLGVGFFLINLVPVLGFIRISYMRITWVSDHFAYISLIGIVGLAAASAGKCYEVAEPHLKPWLRGAVIAIFAIFTMESHRYAGVFLNEETMWTFTLSRNPDAWQAHSRLSAVMMKKGNFGAAFFHSGEALRLRPDLPETHNNYASALAEKGEFEEALANQQLAVELAPDSAFLKMNLANLLARAGRRDEAKKIFGQLLEMAPNEPMFLCNYGVALFFEGRADEALPYFEKAVAINPNMELAQSNLAAIKAYLNRGGAANVNAPDRSHGIQFFNSDSPIQFFPR